MKRLGFLIVAASAVLLGAEALQADGMIVPVDPNIRLRQAWSVKYHRVDITVRDQVASVSIDQEFVNNSRGMIEVEYLFPVPPGAAVDSMTLMVDGKEFTAKLLKADEARKIYEDIVRKKKDPALLEYAGYGLYRTKAFPLQPGKPVRVAVTYKNICRKDNDTVEVWYPLNTEKYSAKPIEDVTVRVDIKSAADITTVYSPTHDVTWDYQKKDPRHVVATYHVKNAIPATDLQLYYQEDNRAVGATLLTWQPESDKDGYSLLLASPNPRTKTKAVAKDIVLVLDHSGSMGGKKILQAKEALAQILNNLNAEDRFNVIAYSSSVEPFFEELQAASADNVKIALDRLDRMNATGGTNIYSALQTAMQMFPETADRGYTTDGRDFEVLQRPAYVIFLTDGLPTVWPDGAKNEQDILKNTKDKNRVNARLFAFGVGYDVNVKLLDTLVRDNHGRSDYVKPNENVEGKIASLYAKIRDPIMTNVKVSVDGLLLKDMYPQEIGDLFAGDQLVAVGRYRLKAGIKRAADESGNLPGTLVITGTIEGKTRTFEYPVTIRKAGRTSGYDFVEKLWAMRRIGWLLDQIQLHGENKEVVDELVALSKTYGIITPYTSFLADETTNLARSGEVADLARAKAHRLSKSSTGATGQMDAANRQTLNEAKVAGPATTQPGGVAQVGYSKTDSYEAGKKEIIGNVRQTGNRAVYQREKLWIADNATSLDPKKDTDKIKTIERFSEEYFDLVRANSTSENRLLAGQQADEELLIVLRNQAYRIK